LGEEHERKHLPFVKFVSFVVTPTRAIPNQKNLRALCGFVLNDSRQIRGRRFQTVNYRGMFVEIASDQ
jgi:hypothetical protein